jgi:hypothetical protein
MSGGDWTGGLEPALDCSMIAERPEDPEMRESASIWLFEENGDFAFPRIGIEAVGAQWDNHRYDYNGGFRGGRILRQSKHARTLPTLGADGRNTVLAAEGLRFECIEPFRKWRVTLDDTPYESRIEEQIRGNFRVFAGTDIDPSLRRAPVRLDVELTMAAPAWTQDYRKEKLAGMSEKQRIDAGLMGYGWRVEQLYRAEGELTIDGQTRGFRGQGSRVHRQSVRPMGEFRGHCWQSAIFPDGRAFGTIAYPLREGETEADRYNLAFLWVDGRWHPARTTKIPFLRNIMPEGDDVLLELESELGVTRIEGVTTLGTFHIGNPGVNGMNNQQGAVRYTWDGQSAIGMIERSSPADQCRVVL